MDEDEQAMIGEQATEIQKLLQKSVSLTDGMLLWVTVLDIIIPLVMIIVLAIQGGSSMLDTGMIIVGGLIVFSRYSLHRASPLMYVSDISKLAKNMLLTRDDIRVERFLFLLRNAVVITTLIIIVAMTSLFIVTPGWLHNVIVICGSFAFLVLFMCALYAYRYFRVAEILVH
jgi:hypothetical protein